MTAFFSRLHKRVSLVIGTGPWWKECLSQTHFCFSAGTGVDLIAIDQRKWLRSFSPPTEVKSAASGRRDESLVSLAQFICNPLQRISSVSKRNPNTMHHYRAEKGPVRLPRLTPALYTPAKSGRIRALFLAYMTRITTATPKRTTARSAAGPRHKPQKHHSVGKIGF
ncbi:uncharacterized [Tachysurus ichikawai]